MSKKVLVLNMGMKSIRSIIYDQEGNKLTQSSCPISTGLNESRVFQDADEWWGCAAKVIRESIKSIRDEAIDYITVTASASCLIYVDADGRALDECIMVSDKRAVQECQMIRRIPSYHKLAERTGIEVSTSSMFAKILWVKNNRPDLFEKTYRFLSPNDFLLARMTGKYVTDTFNAQKLYYDAEKGTYPTDFLQDLGISVEQLPSVVPVGTTLGSVKEEAAKFLGLSSGTEAIVTTYDAICSFFGSGVAQEGEASDVSGTVTVLRALSYKEGLSPSKNVFSMPYAEKGCHIVGGSNNLGGGLIEWTKQCYYNREEFPYEVMEREAKESAIGAGGLIFLPYLLGERAPIWDDTVRGCFFGLERYHTRKDMTRAVFESTGFIDMDFVRAIEDTGVEIKSIRMSGGLARFHLISQIKADITGKEVQVLADFETTAAGAAMMVFESAGVFRDIRHAAEAFADIRLVIRPSYRNYLKYQKVYLLFKRFYEETKELYRERNRLFFDIYNTRDCTIENI